MNKTITLNLTETAFYLILKGLSKLTIEEAGTFFTQLKESGEAQLKPVKAPATTEEPTN